MMKSKLLAISLFVLTVAVVGFYPVYQEHANAKPQQSLNNPEVDVVDKRPRIQLAILLDTSSSMSGLIDQTRNQLWQVVNEFASAKHNGVSPRLEVAVYEYGNSRLSAETGFVHQITSLTGELDQVSEALFSLTTNGGDEYCGYVINTAVKELNWSKSDNDIKAIFIAGNEPFTQGPLPYKQAIDAAKRKGITVNTIHAGPFETGANSGWKDGAMLAGGDYMSIDHNHRVAHIVAPQDKRIAELNAELNKTYIPYGAKGREKAQRQLKQDKQNEAISAGLLAKRAKSKVSSFYDNRSWDLVDAMEQKQVELESMPASALPEEMRKLDMSDQKKYVQQKAAKRKKLKEEISQLSRARDEFVAKKKRETATASVNTMDDAMTQAIRKQGEKKNYTFEKKQ